MAARAPRTRPSNGAGSASACAGPCPDPKGAFSPPARPDEALLAAYAAGDSGAAAPLAQRHAPRVLAVVLRMLNDMAEAEAEDVTQEAMMRLWRVAPDWQAGRADFDMALPGGGEPVHRPAAQARAPCAP